MYLRLMYGVNPGLASVLRSNAITWRLFVLSSMAVERSGTWRSFYGNLLCLQFYIPSLLPLFIYRVPITSMLIAFLVSNFRNSLQMSPMRTQLLCPSPRTCYPSCCFPLGFNLARTPRKCPLHQYKENVFFCSEAVLSVL